MVRVKICGITEIEPALVAARAGADFIGLVFAPGRHQITAGKAHRIVQKLREQEIKTEVVGVFVNLSIADVNQIAATVPLDRVQLSGDETWEYCRNIEKPVIKAVYISAGVTGSSIIQSIYSGQKMLSEINPLVLLDTQRRGMYGGTGQTFNWELAREAAQHYPVVIAGGLTPENITQAINTVHPWGVDVSSGLETSGVKDAAKIQKFIQIVRGMECERDIQVSF
jgi:phosphoribosylanthranilate isomerase